MTPAQLKAKAEAALAAGHALTLVLSRAATGERIRLARRSGPFGEVLCVNSKNQTVARFDPEAVLAWGKRTGLWP